jgi:hypothetical protein
MIQRHGVFRLFLLFQQPVFLPESVAYTTDSRLFFSSDILGCSASAVEAGSRPTGDGETF